MHTLHLMYNFHDEDRDIEYGFHVPFVIDEGRIEIAPERDITLVSVVDHHYGDPMSVTPTDPRHRDRIVAWFCRHHKIGTNEPSEWRGGLIRECWERCESYLEDENDRETERRVDEVREGVAL